MDSASSKGESTDGDVQGHVFRGKGLSEPSRTGRFIKVKDAPHSEDDTVGHHLKGAIGPADDVEGHFIKGHPAASADRRGLRSDDDTEGHRSSRVLLPADGASSSEVTGHVARAGGPEPIDEEEATEDVGGHRFTSV